MRVSKQYTLPVPSVELVAEPVFVIEAAKAELGLAYEVDGVLHSTRFRFTGVTVTRFVSERGCGSEELRAMDTLLELHYESDWVSSLKQRRSSEFDGIPFGHHFRIHLRDVGCFDVISDKYELIEESAGVGES